MEIKKLSKKATRYMAAAGAFLAVGHQANAYNIQGTVAGDNNLDHLGDMALVDLDNDSNPEFAFVKVGVAYYSSSYVYSYALIFGFSFSFGSSNYFALDSGYAPWAKFYATGKSVGPLSRPGVITVINSHNYGFSSAAADAIQNNPGLGSIGVSFMKNGNIHYGFIQYYTNDDNNTLKIFNAYYQSAMATSITASSANVPLLPIASGIGIGIIGLFAFLKRRKQLAPN